MSATMVRNDYRRILQPVGIVWIVLGLIDIIYFAYRVTNSINPPSHSCATFVLIIIGFFLYRGNLKLARWMGILLPFLLVIFLGGSFIGLVIKPPELWAVELRQYPIQTIAYLFHNIIQLVIAIWTWKQLRRQTVLKAYAAASLDTNFPKFALAFVSGLVVVFGFWMHSLMTGENAVEAKMLAQAQLGANYAYHVTGIRWSGNTVSASVVAYSDDEIRFTTVTWNRDKPK